MKLNIELTGKTLRVGGHLHVGADFERLESLLLDGRAHTVSHGSVRIHLDVAGVTSGSSQGIRQFQKCIARSTRPVPPIVYECVSWYWFLQLGLLPDILRAEDRLESVVLPMIDEDDGLVWHAARVGTDIPILADYTGFVFALDINGRRHELDARSEDTFRILSQKFSGQAQAPRNPA